MILDLDTNVLEEYALSIFRVVDSHLQDYMLSQSRKPQHEHTPVGKPKTLNKAIESVTQKWSYYCFEVGDYQEITWEC
jgi:hypothetical protein